MRAALLALALVLPLVARAEVIDRIACIVDDQVILLSEVQDRVRILRTRSPQTPRLDLEREALDALVAEKLLEKQLHALGIDVRPSELKMAIEDVVRQNGLPSEEALKAALQRQGLSWEEYTETLRKQLAHMKLINLRVRSQVKVDEEEVRRRYAEILAGERGEEEIRASHLLVHAPADAPPAALERARKVALELLARARAGESLEELARIPLGDAPQRTAGDLGWFRRGEMLPELEEAAFALQPGQLSEPVRTRFGYHIVLVRERREVPPPDYEEVAARLREALYQEELERQTRRYVESLKKEAVIEYPMPELAPPTARAAGTSG
ncbi:MAG: peptidylprolyl isomerase [Pseudomonadota bacterium]